MQTKNPQISEIMRLSGDVAALTPEARAELLQESAAEVEAAQHRHSLLEFLCNQAGTKVTATKHPAPKPGVVAKPTVAPAPTRPATTKTLKTPPAKKTAKVAAKKTAPAQPKKRRAPKPLEPTILYEVHQAVAEGTSTYAALNGKFSDRYPNKFPKTDVGDDRFRTYVRRLVREGFIKFEGKTWRDGKYKSVKPPVKPG
jgi:hypothetical protein